MISLNLKWVISIPEFCTLIIEGNANLEWHIVRFNEEHLQLVLLEQTEDYIFVILNVWIKKLCQFSEKF